MTHESTTKIAAGLTATVAIFVLAAVPACADSVDARHALAVASATIFESYRTAPALVLVMTLAISVLLAVGAVAAVRWVLNVVVFKFRSLASPEDSASNEAVDEISGSGAKQPYVEVQIGNSDVRCALLGDMLRIGREDDNDIRIPSDAVGLYHAAIHRQDEDDWHITEIAGTSGKGLIVNGRRCGQAQLHDGDVIELGPGRLRFHAAYA